MTTLYTYDQHVQCRAARKFAGIVAGQGDIDPSDADLARWLEDHPGIDDPATEAHRELLESQEDIYDTTAKDENEVEQKFREDCQMPPVPRLLRRRKLTGDELLQSRPVQGDQMSPEDRNLATGASARVQAWLDSQPTDSAVYDPFRIESWLDDLPDNPADNDDLSRIKSWLDNLPDDLVDYDHPSLIESWLDQLPDNPADYEELLAVAEEI
ncbi:MAG: hypothetical protein Q9219_001404 [cf. Caloplaca sp. 3 TL-2023]